MENITFRASNIAPGHNEVTYWVDLSESKLGKAIKVYNHDTNGWENIGSGQGLLEEIDNLYSVMGVVSSMADNATEKALENKEAIERMQTTIDDLRVRVETLEDI